MFVSLRTFIKTFVICVNKPISLQAPAVLVNFVNCNVMFIFKNSIKIKLSSVLSQGEKKKIYFKVLFFVGRPRNNSKSHFSISNCERFLNKNICLKGCNQTICIHYTFGNLSTYLLFLFSRTISYIY